MSKGIGIRQKQILAILQHGPVSFEYIRHRMFPDVYSEKNPNEMNIARVIISRSVSSLVRKKMVLRSGQEKKGCIKIELNATSVNTVR